MAPRPTWKGYLKLSLVSVGVKAYTAADNSHANIQLNQLHAECHSRIRYKKTCPTHGEVPSDEIILGYQIGEDQYVPIADEELAAIRTKSEQTIEISTFIGQDELDDRFLTERSYYLVPDAKIAQKPYALIRDTLEQSKLRAVAEIILNQREQHVVVRPLGKLLIMTVLQHQQELKTPEGFEEHVDDVRPEDQEMKLTKQLVSALTREQWDFGMYKDNYQEKLSALIAAKVEGKELVQPAEAEAPTIINLMDALKASIEQIPVPEKATAKASSSTKSKAAAEKPAKKVAASSPNSGSKRKTSRKTG